MARPLKDISAREVELLASCGATMQEIAAKLDCHVDTIRDRFSSEVERGRDSGKMSLRLLQWQSAKNGNVAMQIWLGKQWLAQRDRFDFTHESTEDLLAEAARYFSPDTAPDSRTRRTPEARSLPDSNE